MKITAENQAGDQLQRRVAKEQQKEMLQKGGRKVKQEMSSQQDEGFGIKRNSLLRCRQLASFASTSFFVSNCPGGPEFVVAIGFALPELTTTTNNEFSPSTLSLRHLRTLKMASELPFSLCTACSL